MMRLKASFDGSLKLAVEGQTVDDFMRTPLWKVRLGRLRRYVASTSVEEITFKKDLTRHEIENLLAYTKEAASQKGYETVLSPSLCARLEEGGVRAEALRATGLSIKSRDASVMAAFREYSSALKEEFVRPLREQQAWDSFFMCSMRKSANFSVPGSGKTASTLGMFAYLRRRGLVERLVVVCPKNAFGSWRDEWEACFGGNLACSSLCFHDPQFAMSGSAEKKRVLSLNLKRYNLVLLNYESLGALKQEAAEAVSSDCMLVFDEVHKVKRVNGVRASNALAVASRAEYVVALTGTPIPNSYRDLFNLLNILFPEDYSNLFGFNPGELDDPDEDGIARINEALQPFFCRTNKESLGVPPANEDEIYEVAVSEGENRLLREVRSRYKDDPLSLIIRILQIESDPSMMYEALDEDCRGFLFDEDNWPSVDADPMPKDLERFARECAPTAKTLRCLELVADLVSKGKQVIVWCVFKKSMGNIEHGLKKMGIKARQINGGTPSEERGRIIELFKAGKIDVLVTNPHTLAESVSLHRSCHDAVYFEYSYNLVHLLQSKDRIHRLGLPDDQYTQYHFLRSVFNLGENRWSLDANIHERLREKETTMLEAIDRGVLETCSADQDDLAEVFSGLFDEFDQTKTPSGGVNQ